MRVLLLGTSLVALLAATPAHAIDPPDDGAAGPSLMAASSTFLAGNVKRIYPTSDGVIHFRLAGACKSTTYFNFSTASQAGKNWYAMLLGAAASNRPVRIALVDACNDVAPQPVQYVFQDL